MIDCCPVYFGGWLLLLLAVSAGLWRIARGPTNLDRIVGFDAVMVALVGMIVLFSIRERTAEYVELILLVTALGFLTTVSYFYYFSQPNRQSGVHDVGGSR